MGGITDLRRQLEYLNIKHEHAVKGNSDRQLMYSVMFKPLLDHTHLRR